MCEKAKKSPKAALQYRWVPYERISKGIIELRIEELVPNESTPIICYCGGGSRSALAADNLQKMGYTNVASMSGGFKQWRAEGLPTQ